jgi:hypothetical protein
MVEWGRTAHIVAQQLHVLVLKLLRLKNGKILFLKVLHCGIENLGHVGSAKLSVESVVVN